MLGMDGWLIPSQHIREYDLMLLVRKDRFGHGAKLVTF